MIITPERIITEARKCLGTPWHHAGRLPGVGLDCTGLVLAVLWALGVAIDDEVNYTRGDEYARMLGRLPDCAKLLAEDVPWLSGDVLVFRGRQMTNHCGFYVADGTSDGAMIHAYNSPSIGKVVEHRLDANWRKRIAGRYRLRGVMEATA